MTKRHFLTGQSRSEPADKLQIFVDKRSADNPLNAVQLAHSFHFGALSWPTRVKVVKSFRICIQIHTNDPSFFSGLITVNRLSYPDAAGVWKSIGGGFSFCQGYYQNRMPVYLKRMPIGEASREIQRELYALKLSGNVHENVVRFITSENDATKTFT